MLLIWQSWKFNTCKLDKPLRSNEDIELFPQNNDSSPIRPDKFKEFKLLNPQLKNVRFERPCTFIELIEQPLQIKDCKLVKLLTSKIEITLVWQSKVNKLEKFAKKPNFLDFTL